MRQPPRRPDPRLTALSNLRELLANIPFRANLSSNRARKDHPEDIFLPKQGFVLAGHLRQRSQNRSFGYCRSLRLSSEVRSFGGGFRHVATH
jgi:hypothetical protein